MVYFFYFRIDPSPENLPVKNQIVLAKGRNFLVEPETSGLKFLVIPRSLKMDTLPGTRKMKILQNGYLTGKPSSW